MNKKQIIALIIICIVLCVVFINGMVIILTGMTEDNRHAICVRCNQSISYSEPHMLDMSLVWFHLEPCGVGNE